MDESETGGNSTKGSGKGRGRRGLGRREMRAYEWALEAVLAIPIGFGIGYLVDEKLGTGPFGLIGGGALGFVAFVRRLLQMRSAAEAGSGGDDGDGRRDGPGQGSGPRDDGGRSGS